MAFTNAYDCGSGTNVRTRVLDVVFTRYSRIRSGLVGVVKATELKLSIRVKPLARTLKREVFGENVEEAKG